MSEPYPLELDPEAMTSLVDAALDRLRPYLAGIAERPASEGAPDDPTLAALARPPRSEPAAAEALLDHVFDAALPWGYHAAGPGYMAYVPGGGVVPAAVADLVSGVLNRYVGIWAAAPGLVQLEVDVIRWMCDLVGYGPEAGGFLTTGGSLANFTAIYTARRERLPADFLRGTIYTSEQTHHSVVKAAMLAGFPPDNVRLVATDERFRVDVGALAAAVQRDRRDGFRPFLVVGHAGTTNSGAVDPLERLADLAASEGLWLHVDAAYGGFFLLTERGRTQLGGSRLADSVTLDPHKGLFLPYGTGALVVRDRAALARAHTVRADYMTELQVDARKVDLCNISPELSRPARGLRVWLPLHLFGLDAFARTLDEKLDLAERARQGLGQIPDVEIVAEPQLSIVAFRWVPRSGAGDPEALDALNRRLVEAINARRRVFLSGTTLGGRFVIRICVVCFRTHAEHVDAALADLRAAMDELAPAAAG